MGRGYHLTLLLVLTLLSACRDIDAASAPVIDVDVTTYEHSILDSVVVQFNNRHNRQPYCVTMVQLYAPYSSTHVTRNGADVLRTRIVNMDYQDFRNIDATGGIMILREGVSTFDIPKSMWEIESGDIMHVSVDIFTCQSLFDPWPGMVWRRYRLHTRMGTPAAHEPGTDGY